MIVHQMRDAPPADLARRLAEFEAAFTYPLGPGRSFRIDHGEDYPRFYRAIGEATCFVAVHADRVLATLCVAVRRLALPDGTELAAAYIGDLKLASEARGGLTLLRLAKMGEAWVRPKVQAAYCVVMDGTPVTPLGYTGRAGIREFKVVGHVVVLRLPAQSGLQPADQHFSSDSGPVLKCYRNLSRGRFAGLGGTPTERSEHAPEWLLHPERMACGLLEDTRRAKRLIADDGSEMCSMHLSHFAYRTVEAGAELLEVALSRTARLDVPALFVSVAVRDVDDLCWALGGIEAVAAPATVYGAGLSMEPEWNINTSEI
jgi:hypothetical protein